MAVEDFVSRRQFAEDDINAPPDESPPRPTMGAADHLGDQFHSVIPAREKDLGYDSEADAQDWMNELRSKRRANYVGDQTVHQYRTSPK